MKDLENIEDIKILVNTFYTKVQNNDSIGFFFNDIAKVDWSLHLPKMYQFWSSILFGDASYKGNPMQKHFPINAQQSIKKHHFNEWLNLWTNTVQELFQGKNADLVIYKATNIANLMAYKMDVATKLESNSKDR